MPGIPYRPCVSKSVATGSGNYNIHLAWVQAVRWDEPAGDYTILYGIGVSTGGQIQQAIIHFSMESVSAQVVKSSRQLYIFPREGSGQAWATTYLAGRYQDKLDSLYK
jgi:hypothetical protein